MTRRITRGHEALRRWYDDRRTAYPWRGAEPYGVLVSEVMLQQTQASRVAPAYRSFMSRFPTVWDLAAAPRSDVVRQWGSLGYPRRAVALSEAARAIVRDHGGSVPAEPAVLASLPGIGPYTAAAVASLGFGAPVPALDTNVRRVVRRVILGRDDATAAETQSAAEHWLDRRDPAAFNQALMDVGRTHCRTRPRCGGCPLSRSCSFRLAGGVPSPAVRNRPRYEGSLRQLRGSILREVRSRTDVTMSALVAATGRSFDEVTAAVSDLADEGFLVAVADRGMVRTRTAIRLAR